VEFSAADGILHSNSYLFDKLGAQRILAERCKFFHKALVLNGKTILNKRCVYRTSGETIMFEEMLNAQLSKVSEIQGTKLTSNTLEILQKYLVSKVSLQDL
jgi:hypothetical protein